jgi:hypothetical protein
MQRRNWPAGLGLALGVAAFVGYMAAIALRVGPPTSTLRDTAVLNLAVIGIGLGFSVIGIRRAFGRPPTRRGRRLAPILGALNLGVAVLFVLFLFRFSELPPLGAVPAVGTAAPDFVLTDDTGAPQQLAALRGRNVLLVFYRGHW